ncbi:MAG: MFS transporter, partial [Spirochaetes bacterium]|nr:MFS transporter [Spirochaetota bacterium]
MIKKNIFQIYKPAPFKPLLPSEKIDASYKKMRIQMMLTIFSGYAAYYLVRKNFSLAKPYLIREWGFTPGDVGLVASALSIAYGISKFVMGNISDRSNPRYFMATGLIASGIINLFFGTLPSVFLMTIAWFINGWF